MGRDLLKLECCKASAVCISIHHSTPWNACGGTDAVAHQVEGSPVAFNGCQFGLDLLFFDSSIGDLFQLFPVLQDLALQQVLKLEDILGQLQLMACNQHNGMAYTVLSSEALDTNQQQ